jgi:predicted glycosyltransferase
MKVICAVSTPFQVNFFEELTRRRPDEEYLFAARDRDATLSMLEQKKLPYLSLGGYGGSSLEKKLEEFANSLIVMGETIIDFKPDLILTERYPPAVHAAHLADIPCWTIFNDEREFHVNRLTHPLAKRVLVPDFYDNDILRGQGVTIPEKIIWFHGFITCYLKDAPMPEEDPYKDLEGIREGLPILLIRPEFEFSVFFKGYKPILEKVVKSILTHFDVNAVVLPRTSVQRKRYLKIGAIVPEYPLPGNPVAHSDIVLGSAETMLCEAFTLGIPAVSCIYWDLTVPMQILHKYIPKSTSPTEVSSLVSGFLESKQKLRDYKENSKQVIGQMDNPVEKFSQLMEDMGQN